MRSAPSELAPVGSVIELAGLLWTVTGHQADTETLAPLRNASGQHLKAGEAESTWPPDTAPQPRKRSRTAKPARAGVSSEAIAALVKPRDVPTKPKPRKKGRGRCTINTKVPYWLKKQEPAPPSPGAVWFGILLLVVAAMMVLSPILKH